MTAFSQILQQLDVSAYDNRNKGDLFEKLIKGYLKTDPLYVEQFSDVWQWIDFPERGGKVDTGIDVVAKNRNDDGYTAIQCKFYARNHTLAKDDLDSFFTASGKRPFTARIIVSTTDRWSKHAEDALEHQQIPVSRIRFRDLADAPIEWSKFSIEKPERLILKPQKEIRPHQQTALENVVSGFETFDRGKLIMACGTGKTFTALKIMEHILTPGGYVLFLVPSISLLSQSLKEWSAQAQKHIRFFAVCSDSKIGKDAEDIRDYDLAFPATTKVEALAHYARPLPDKDVVTVIFSTYL